MLLFQNLFLFCWIMSQTTRSLERQRQFLEWHWKNLPFANDFLFTQTKFSHITRSLPIVRGNNSRGNLLLHEVRGKENCDFRKNVASDKLSFVCFCRQNDQWWRFPTLLSLTRFKQSFLTIVKGLWLSP